MYKISIIIPVYNVGKYLSNCIESLERQTIGFDNLEIIIADDCSTDDSKLIMMEYEKKFANVKCVYLNKNSGAAGAPRNEALKIATSDYIMFLDSDDEYYDDACQVLFKKIEITNADCVSGYYSALENNIILAENMHEKSKIKEGLYYIPEDIDKISDFQVHLACKIYRKTIIDNNILFPEKIIGADSVFVWRYFCKSKSVYYVDSPILKYKQRKGKDKSKSYVLTPKYFEETCSVLRLVKQCFVMYGYEDKFEFACKDINNYLIEQLINSQMSSIEIKEVLNNWNSIVNHNKKIINFNSYTNLVIDDLLSDNIELATKRIGLLQEIKSYNDEMIEAKIFFEKKYMDNEILVNNLRQWIDEITIGKNWIEEQYNNIRLEVEQLNSWCKELEKEKKWSESQYKMIKEEYDKLKQWCDELQKGKDWVENEWKNKCEECERLKEALADK